MGHCHPLRHYIVGRESGGGGGAGETFQDIRPLKISRMHPHRA